MTPEEKLCSRWWRLGNSAWILFPILSFGFLTWVGFLWIGIKAKRLSWWLPAVLYALVAFVYIALPGSEEVSTKEAPVDSVRSDMTGWMVLIAWVGGTIHAFVINRSWLRWRAHNPASVWYVNSSATSPIHTAPASDAIDAALRGQNAPAQPSGNVSPQPVHNPQQTMPIDMVDLNHASADQLMYGLGLDRQWAEWIIATRARLGGFSQPDQLLTDGQMPPHMYLPLSGRVTATPLEGPPKPSSVSGRRLDL